MAGTSVTHYLNGQPNGSGTLSTSILDADGSLRVGNRDDLFTDMLGLMDDVVIYNQSLTSGQITALMNGDFGDDDLYGVLNEQDLCPGFDDNIDTDGDGVADGCDDACTPSFAATYDVLLDTVNPPQTMICQDALEPFCPLPAMLENCTSYYWQIIAKNYCGHTPGPVWSFTTTAVADLTDECDVNYFDFGLLHGGWCNVACSDANGWCNGVDMNRDGVVDILELALMAKHWL